MPSGAVPEPPRPLAPARASKEETNEVGQVGNDIIAAFGFDPGAGDTLTTRIYDIASDTWTTGSDGPLPGRSEGAAVTHDGSLYAVGGRAGSVLPNLDRYTPATDTWASLAPMPTARAGLDVARVSRAIYAIGGRTNPGGPCTGGELATVERYDIASDTWTTVAPLPSARSDLAAKTKGDKIYVFGGCAGGAFLGNVDVYDPNTDTWSTAPADLPTPRAAIYAVGKKGGTIFVIGGYAGGAALGVNEANKVSKDTWSTWARMITPRASCPTAGGSTRSAGRCRRSGPPPTRTRSSSPRRPESARLSPTHPQSEGILSAFDRSRGVMGGRRGEKTGGKAETSLKRAVSLADSPACGIRSRLRSRGGRPAPSKETVGPSDANHDRRRTRTGAPRHGVRRLRMLRGR